MMRGTQYRFIYSYQNPFLKSSTDYVRKAATKIRAVI